MKKIIFSILIFFIIFLIYKNSDQHQIVYVALGDSLSQGKTPYGNINYGYSDYIADYISKNYTLKYYTKEYSQSNYQINDIINQINNNQIIEDKNKRIYLKELLRNSNIVTISVGFNQMINNIIQTNDNQNIYKMIDDQALEIDNMLKLIKRYAKGTIVLVGYYKPLINNSIIENKHIIYSNIILQKTCKNNNVNFIKISDVFQKDNKYLPNPLDIHPNNQGYIAIAEKIISLINKKL